MQVSDVASSILFGSKAQVGVNRGRAEFQAGRPVLVAAQSEIGKETIVAMSVEGLDRRRLAAFASLCAPALPRLIVTARRAQALDFVAAAPLALQLTPGFDAEAVLALVSDARCDCALAVAPAGAAAAAAIELAKLAHLLPAVLVAPCAANTAASGIPMVRLDAAAVAQFRADVIRSLKISSEAQVPLDSGVSTRFVVFSDAIGESTAAVIVGEPDLSKPVPVRLHSACLTGDVFGSRRCDCGDQLKLALSCLEAEGGGIILYLAQEGRGLGLANKMRTYRLQDGGLDTVDANTTLGFDDDERDYGVAARMLRMLGCNSVILLTNNPAKLNGLAQTGIEIVGRMPLQAPVNADNLRYMTAKAARAGHRLDHMRVSLGCSPEIERLAVPLAP